MTGEARRRGVASAWDTTDAAAQAQEDRMHQHYLRRGVFVSLLGGMFVLGFLSGSVSQRSAQAQVPGVGKGMLEQATGAGEPWAP